LKVQVIEESQSEAFMTAKVDNPMLRREQMAEQLRKSKRQELISKKRYPQLSEIAEELEETRRTLAYHEQRIYGHSMQEATIFDDAYEGAL
jgi:hypothetical protein